MDRKKKKLKKYSERHLRRLVRKETNLLVSAITNESNSDSSDYEASGSATNQSEETRPMDLAPYIPSSLHSSDNAIVSLGDESSNSSKDFNITDSSCSNNTSSDDSSITQILNQRMPDSPATSFKQDLVQWAIKFNIPHNALSSLLVTLNTHTDFNLPSDSRTLLHTPRQIQIHQLDNGFYYHFGLDRVLSTICIDYILYDINTDIINIILNVDGLPISKSSSSCLWPILCSDTEIKKVHLVGAYYGMEKPKSANDFLEKVVEELINFIENGFMHENKCYQVKLYALVCDAPAKSFVLSVKGHTGFSSCTKCTVQGDYLNDRVCFVDCTSATPRTHETFLSQTDEDYHNGETILKNVPNFDLVLDVPSDYMHLVCLGAVKKIITLWIKGPLSVRISGAQIKRISSMLEDLKNTVPSEFVRKPRSLQWWKRWKATELRQLLLYLGPLVLKSELRPDVYKHFMTLHVAITILSSPSHLSKEENIQYAQDLLGHFVTSFGIIYGNEFISHNIHVLLNLADDVRRYGPLDSFSAFRFENNMLDIKKKLRKSDKPLQQLAKRYEETHAINFSHSGKEKLVSQNFMKDHEDWPLPTELDHVDAQYKIYKAKNFVIICDDEKNNCCMLKDGTVVVVSNIVVIDNQFFIVGKRQSVMEDFYSTPCQSNFLNIHVVEFENSFKFWQIKDIIAKLWKMPNTSQRSFVVIPVIHTRL